MYEGYINSQVDCDSLVLHFYLCVSFHADGMKTFYNKAKKLYQGKNNVLYHLICYPKLQYLHALRLSFQASAFVTLNRSGCTIFARHVLAVKNDLNTRTNCTIKMQFITDAKFT